MMRTSFFLGAALLALGAATPASRLSRRYVVKESHRVPRDFKWERDAPGEHRMQLQIGLKQGRFDELERHLYEISDPDHARYGQHLTAAQVNELVAPSAETLTLVQDWLHEHVDPEDVTYSPASDFLTITLPVSKVEELLDTKYSVYRYTDGSTIIRTPDWKLPLHLHEHVTAVQPTTSFFRKVPQAKLYMGTATAEPKVKPRMHRRSNNGSTNGTVEKVCDPLGVTPTCLRTLYETVNYVPQVPGENQLGLTNYLNEPNNRSDTRLFLSAYRPEALAGADNFTIESVANGTLRQTPNGPEDYSGREGDLDIQTLLGISWPTPIKAWSTGGAPPGLPDVDHPVPDNEPYLTWVNHVLEQEFVPQVISNSYEDNEQTVPESYAKVVCSQFAALSARGVSIIFGSGDGGVGGYTSGGSCISNKDNSTQFIPLFPSSCPYVTSVGGTQGFGPEVVAMSDFYTSGGGFSNYFARPQYQEDAVSGYLDTIGDKFKGLYNTSGRAYPDIAAHSMNYTIFWNGTMIQGWGTSAATPTIAAILSLLNDALIANGKSTLGFLNPWLYKYGKKAFVDVVSGSAAACNTTGFPAVEGWDAVSGFGTPRFSKLLEAVGLSDELSYPS